ncbi:MAG TPA: helix-hairpin-helix domain-containing protein [Symbiobacteriaceae bacterium]|nr:helix-hairpin-helix domain-containing protein [Symbiobacteriaceae bacterium]
MENTEIARRLCQIADLMELHDENPHKVGAFRKGAEALLLVPEQAVSLASQGRLAELPGIGPSLKAQIEELLATGSTRLWADLQGRTEPALLALLAIPGLQPRLARLLWERHGIDSPAVLVEALLAGRLRDLPGFGPREEQALLRAIARTIA